MNWQDLIYIALAIAVWLLLITKILPKFGIGS